jgi:hypothetical protein
VMNSVLMRGGEWSLLLAVNGVVVAVLFALEREWGFRYESSQLIRYDRIELIKPDQYAVLLADLRQRTGLPVKRVEFGRLNFLNDTAEMRVFYDESDPQRRRWHSDIALTDEFSQGIENT